MTGFIEADHVTLQYGEAAAIQNVTFSLIGNKINGLLGLNGAGKTSLLTSFAAFQRPGSAKIMLLIMTF